MTVLQLVYLVAAFMGLITILSAAKAPSLNESGFRACLGAITFLAYSHLLSWV
jgi:hypothetical protein